MGDWEIKRQSNSPPTAKERNTHLQYSHGGNYGGYSLFDLKTKMNQEAEEVEDMKRQTILV